MNNKINNSVWISQEYLACPMLATLANNSSFIPLQEYLGESYSVMLFVVENTTANFMVRQDEMRAIGQRMIDMLMCPQYALAYNTDMGKNQKKAMNMASEILENKYSFEDAIQTFEKFSEVYVSYFKFGCFSEAVGMQAEHLLTNYVKDPNKLAALLTPPPEQNAYIIDILKSLRDCKAGKITPEQHAKKYFWCENNYLETKCLTAGDIENEIKKHTLSYYDNLIKTSTDQKQKLLKQKDEILPTLSNYYQNIVKIATEIGVKLIDERKTVMQYCCAAFDKLLGIVAEHTNTPMADIRLLTAQELRYFTEHLNTYKERFSERRKMFLTFQSKFPILDEIIERTDKIMPMEEAFMAEGEVAEKALQQLNAKLNIFLDDNETDNKLQGIVAYKKENEIIGIACVIKNPKKETLSAGEILVAAHTTPDYLNAMNKATAIIVDWGGQTSHAAIISRELKKPCVIGTNYASNVLQTGQKIKINFTDGTIEVIK
ncbi:MAG: hypothetical protein LBN07_03045 [Christensenellaceae bacterium]|jgi:phosphohistidine swiveling domain-containing protein|nr:hypothetical protein [Christensenellaceae bacterium]